MSVLRELFFWHLLETVKQHLQLLCYRLSQVHRCLHLLLLQLLLHLIFCLLRVQVPRHDHLLERHPVVLLAQGLLSGLLRPRLHDPVLLQVHGQLQEVLQ